MIVDDKFTVIDNDIEKIEAKPSMYISYTGSQASIHLCREIINNAIDEHLNKNTISDGNIMIIYNPDENLISVQDTGRGISFDDLENACTILHAGTKMLREYGSTAGENGAGLTVTNALSELFEITSTRNGKAKFLQFREGKKVLDKTKKINSDKHGLMVSFKPSRIYLGDCNVDVEELKDWLLKQSFFLPTDLKIKFTIVSTNKEVPDSSIVYRNTTGIGGFLAKLNEDYSLLKTPIVFSSECTIEENDIPTHTTSGEIQMIDMMRTLSLEVAINYNAVTEQVSDGVYYSFCNNIETIEGGVHVEAVISGFVSYMKKEFKKAKKKEEKEVTNGDIVNGLGLVINFNTDYSTSVFTSQTKHKIGQRAFYDPIKKMVIDSLETYFNIPDNRKILTKLIGIVNDNIKIRMAATKIRRKIRKDRKSFMESKLITEYVAPNNLDDSNAYREIYIVEGDSAGGSARQGRFNPDVQGILGLRGKPTNVYGWTEKMMSNQRMASDVKQLFDDILGCGYDKSFNMNDLVYDKIIVMPDADIDGGHIMGLVTANIYDHAKQLLEEGKVYRAITPLYRIEGDGAKKVLYLYDKGDYFDMYTDRISKLFKLKYNENDDFISTRQMKKFLETNRDYSTWLELMSGYYTIHPDIIEFIAANPNDFRSRLNELSNEVEYDKKEDIIKRIIYKGHYYTLIIEDIFLNSLKRLTKNIMEGNNGVYKFHLYKKYKTKSDPEHLGYLTIGQIMSICKEYEPKIYSRYKGLGELNPKEMLDLVMNPNNRKLVRLTLNDGAEASKLMHDLFSKSNDARLARKDMVNQFEVSIDDIDN